MYVTYATVGTAKLWVYYGPRLFTITMGQVCIHTTQHTHNLHEYALIYQLPMHTNMQCHNTYASLRTTSGSIKLL